MNKLTLATAFGAMIASAAPAFAGHRDDDRYERPGRYERYDYAQVVSSRPIVRQVRVSQPRQECWDERVVYEQPRNYQPAIGPGTIIGAVIGGVIGNQFGGGNGRAVATGAGAVIGASVGSQHDAYAYGGYRGRGSVEHVGYEQRCRTVDDVRYQNRVEGYDVTYRYHGRVYHTRLPYDPGNRIAVDVNVRPVQDPIAVNYVPCAAWPLHCLPLFSVHSARARPWRWGWEWA